MGSNIFQYRRTSDGKVFVSTNGKIIKTIKGRVAELFLGKILESNEIESQLLMAKLTGNYKRGNESKHAILGNSKFKNDDEIN